MTKYVYDFGSMEFTIDYTYDANGNKTSEVMSSLGNETGRVDYTYDANGNLIGITNEDIDGDVTAFGIEYKLVYRTFDLPEKVAMLVSELTVGQFAY